jgi:hypothetical protein
LKRLFGVVLLVVMLMTISTSVFAGAPSLDQRAFPAGCGDSDKQALRVYVGENFSGAKELECGNIYYDDSEWPLQSPDGQKALLDGDFGSNSYFGTINSTNDAMTSFIVYNKTKASVREGECLLFDMHAYGHDPVLPWFMPRLTTGAVWVPGRWDADTVLVLAVDNVGPWFNDVASYAIMSKRGNGWSRSECLDYDTAALNGRAQIYHQGG